MFCKNMEKILQELAVLFEIVPEPIYFGDENGIYLANKPGIELLGFNEVEELNQKIPLLQEKLQLRDPSTGERLSSEEDPFLIAYKGKRICKEVLVKHQMSGKDLFLRVSAAPVKRNDKIVAVIVIASCTDISDYRKAEKLLKESAELSRKRNQELVRTNHELDNFFYTVSHDLKAPVNNVEGLIAIFREDEQLSCDEQKAVVEMLEHAVARLKQIILELTDLNKIQKDLMEGKYEFVSFYEITEEVESVIYTMIEENCVRLTKDFEVEGIHMARKNLRSILYNLLSNAAKYRAPDRNCEINIRTYLNNDHIVLSIKDNGLGLDTSKKELFRMFDRHHTHVEGTGLGLYIVKRIVDHYGGSIEVKSEVGKGTEFRLCFPPAQHD